MRTAQAAYETGSLLLQMPYLYLVTNYSYVGEYRGVLRFRHKLTSKYISA